MSIFISINKQFWVNHGNFHIGDILTMIQRRHEAGRVSQRGTGTRGFGGSLAGLDQGTRTGPAPVFPGISGHFWL